MEPSLNHYSLIKENNILISFFSYVLNEKTAFRFYFTDLTNRYVFNPMEEDSNGKKSFPIYFDYDEGLNCMIEYAEVYLDNYRSFPNSEKFKNNIK